jgi:site-specific recombinase XerD
MSYSITPVLHHYADKQDNHKILIRVIFKRTRKYSDTGIKCKQSQFNNGSVTDGQHKVKLNATIRKQVAEIEGRILDFMRQENQSEEMLEQVVKGEAASKQKFTDFVDQYIQEMQGKKAKATIQVYRSLNDELVLFDGKLYFDKIDIRWLNLFEQHQRKKWDNNTVNKKMKNIKGFLKRASERGLIKDAQFKSYQVPTYEQKIPEYLDETEIAVMKEICDTVRNDMMKTAGYYFLLSCSAGYRISDLKRFNHDQFIRGDKIILRAKKNGEITSIPIYPQLAMILNYCKEHPLDMAEQTMREFVKEIAKMAGIARKIKVHTARHSFAMMLMDRGFDLEEVAELMGITVKVAKVYARISNKRLEKKIKEKFSI